MKQANQPQQRFVQLVPSQVILAFQSWLPFAILGGVAGLRRNARSCSCTAVGKDFAANRGLESEFLPMALVSEEDFRRNARQFASQVHGHSRLFLSLFVQDIQCIQFSYVLKYHDWLPWAFISCTRRCWLSGLQTWNGTRILPCRWLTICCRKRARPDFRINESELFTNNLMKFEA